MNKLNYDNLNVNINLDSDITMRNNKIDIRIITGEKVTWHNKTVIMINGNDINYISENEIIKSLETFGMKKSDIKKMLLFKRHESLTPAEDGYMFSDKGYDLYYKAGNKKKDLLYNKSNKTLTKLEYMILKTSRDDIESGNVPKELKSLIKKKYTHDGTHQSHIRELIRLIHKYVSYIKKCEIVCSCDIGKLELELESKFGAKDEALLKINKNLHYALHRWVKVNAVPLTDIINNNDIKKLNERKFINGLTKGLYDKLTKREESVYEYYMLSDYKNLQNELLELSESEILNGRPNPLTDSEQEFLCLPELTDNPDKYYAHIYEQHYIKTNYSINKEILPEVSYKKIKKKKDITGFIKTITNL